MNVTDRTRPGDPRLDASTTDLLREAIAETRRLVVLEVALAKEEVRLELAETKRAVVMFAVAAVAAVLAAAMCFVALGLAIFPGPAPVLAIGAVLIASSIILGVLAWKRTPKNPLGRTRERLETDAHVLKERVS